MQNAYHESSRRASLIAYSAVHRARLAVRREALLARLRRPLSGRIKPGDETSISRDLERTDAAIDRLDAILHRAARGGAR